MVGAVVQVPGWVRVRGEVASKPSVAICSFLGGCCRNLERCYMLLERKDVTHSIVWVPASEDGFCNRLLDERNGDFRVINHRYVNELDDASYGPADIDAPRLQLR